MSKEKKEEQETITTEIIVRQIPVPFEEGDKALEGHIEEYLSAQADAFPIQKKINRLKEDLAPHEKRMKEALNEISRGTSAAVDCVKIINWESGRVIIKTMESGEVIEDREITEDEQQLRAEI